MGDAGEEAPIWKGGQCGGILGFFLTFLGSLALVSFPGPALAASVFLPPTPVQTPVTKADAPVMMHHGCSLLSASGVARWRMTEIYLYNTCHI